MTKLLYELTNKELAALERNYPRGDVGCRTDFEFCAPLPACVQRCPRYAGATTTAALCIVINGLFMRADDFGGTT
jgi:hypothetical protein